LIKKLKINDLMDPLTIRILAFLDFRKDRETLQRDLLNDVKNNYLHITNRLNILLDYKLVLEDERRGKPTKKIYSITEKGSKIMKKIREMDSLL